jgi:hypothetical protein
MVNMRGTITFLKVAAYSGEIAHPFRKHAAQFSEKILVEIIVH